MVRRGYGTADSLAPAADGDDVVDIFDEVEEDLRAERAQQMLKRYGGLIVAVLIAIVAAAAGWQGWRWYEARKDATAAVEYLTAMNLAAASTAAGTSAAGRTAAIAAFADVSTSAPDGYATLARLQEAALKADSGDVQGGATLWDQVASDQSADPLLRDLAVLLWAQHLLDKAEPGVLQARLKPLAEPGSPWHSLAQEQLALLDLRLGKRDEAKTALTHLAQDAGAPNGVRARAAALVGRLGG